MRITLKTLMLLAKDQNGKHRNKIKLINKSRTSHCGSVVTNLTSIHELACLFPGLVQWVTDLALPWAVVQDADVAQILLCCGFSVGWQLQLWFNSKPGNFHVPQMWPWKKKKKRVINKARLFALNFIHTFTKTVIQKMDYIWKGKT